MASGVVPIPIPAADEELLGSYQILYGWTVRESNAAPAVAQTLIRNGSATGTIVGVIDLAANGSTTVWFGPQGVRVPEGVFVDRIAGTLEGSIFVG